MVVLYGFVAMSSRLSEQHPRSQSSERRQRQQQQQQHDTVRLAKPRNKIPRLKSSRVLSSPALKSITFCDALSSLRSDIEAPNRATAYSWAAASPALLSLILNSRAAVSQQTSLPLSVWCAFLLCVSDHDSLDCCLLDSFRRKEKTFVAGIQVSLDAAHKYDLSWNLTLALEHKEKTISKMTHYSNEFIWTHTNSQVNVEGNAREACSPAECAECVVANNSSGMLPSVWCFLGLSPIDIALLSSERNTYIGDQKPENTEQHNENDVVDGQTLALPIHFDPWGLV